MIAECAEYEAVRRMHAELFEEVGGWSSVPCALSADQFRAFMHQPAHKVSAFLYACCQRRWTNPPLEVMFADGLSAAEAEAMLWGEVEDRQLEASEQFYSSLSEEYYDVYSDAFYDTGTP